MELVDRENEILRIVDELSRSIPDFIVVGGYAVSAHTKHRFSVDCDLVATTRDLPDIDSLLQREGFQKGVERVLDSTYGGRFIRYVKRIGKLPVSIDLLVDALVCRQTEGSWSHDYISSNSVKILLPGIQDSIKARTPTKELLIAFKLHSARKPDVRDVIMLGEGVDWKIVQRHAIRGSSTKLKSSLKKFIAEFEDKKLANSLKGVFEIQTDITPLIRRSKEKVQKFLDDLEEKKAKK